MGGGHLGGAQLSDGGHVPPSPPVVTPLTLHLMIIKNIQTYNHTSTHDPKVDRFQYGFEESAVNCILIAL